jgi:hypothetical protein
MRLSFSGDDIEKWARFSYDRNPIHFDREAARRLNADDVVVHGMLALLPVKQELCRLSEPGETNWSGFKALLKAPVLRDTVIALRVKDQTPRLRFRLESYPPNSEHMIGNMRLVAVPQWQSRAPVQMIHEAQVSERLQVFREAFGDDYSAWVQLDALVFGHFIRHHIGDVVNKLEIGATPSDAKYQIEDFPEHLLVQISHETVFHDALRSPKHLERLPAVQYQVDNLNLTRDANTAFGTLQLGITLQSQHVMTIVLGLLIKKDFQPQMESVS